MTGRMRVIQANEAIRLPNPMAAGWASHTNIRPAPVRIKGNTSRRVLLPRPLQDMEHHHHHQFTLHHLISHPSQQAGYRNSTGSTSDGTILSTPPVAHSGRYRATIPHARLCLVLVKGTIHEGSIIPVTATTDMVDTEARSMVRRKVMEVCYLAPLEAWQWEPSAERC